MFDDPNIVGWIVAIVVFVVIEGITLGLATIWFALGAFVGLICALLNFSFPVQLALFIISSLVLLAFTRPIVKDYLKVGKVKTNLDSIIGLVGVITKDIEPFKTGQMKVNGQIWTCISEDNKSIAKDSRVIIINIEGVKLVVKKVEEDE